MGSAELSSFFAFLSLTHTRVRAHSHTHTHTHPSIRSPGQAARGPLSCELDGGPSIWEGSAFPSKPRAGASPSLSLSQPGPLRLFALRSCRTLNWPVRHLLDCVHWLRHPRSCDCPGSIRFPSRGEDAWAGQKQTGSVEAERGDGQVSSGGACPGTRSGMSQVTLGIFWKEKLRPREVK